MISYILLYNVRTKSSLRIIKQFKQIITILIYLNEINKEKYGMGLIIIKQLRYT